MRHRYWTKPEEARLVELFRKSKKNLGECKRLVLADPFLKKQERNWNTCYRKLTHMGLLEEGVQHDTDKYPFAVLTAKDLGRLDDLLRTQGVDAARVAFPQFSVKQFRNRAVLKEIKLGKAETKVIYDRRIGEVVQGGILVNGGLDKLLSTLKAEFSSTVENVTKETLAAQVEEIVWNKKAEEAFRHVVGHG